MTRIEDREVFLNVYEDARKLGYTDKQINIFRLDIIELIDEGKSVEEIIDIVF